MDDFEKKELDGEEAVQSGDADAQKPADESEALLRELEEIRDMFQEAIDSAANGEDDHGELIQELEDVDDDGSVCGEEDDEDELPLCECCGEEPVSTYYGEDYPYCDSCRELMKHYPLRKRGVLALLAMIVVFGLSVYLGLGSLDSALVVLDARTAAAENKMMTTLQSLYTFTSSGDTDSKKAKKLLIDSFIRTGYMSNAKDEISKQFTEEELNRFGNRKYKRTLEFIENFLATRDAVADLVDGAFSGKSFDCDELIAKLELEKEKYIDEEKGIKYNAALIEYYKYELLRLSGADLEKQLDILKAMEKDDKHGLAEWIYVPSICEVAAKVGNKELAEEYFEKMKATNSENMTAYNNLALYYRFLETPDPDSMILLCNEAAKNAYSGDVSYYPTLVVAYLLKGEGALAFDTMGQYMGSSYYTVQNCNLYALCALYCGDTDTYNNMVTTLERSGFEISDLVKKYKEGKLSINEALADLRGDIG